MPRNPVEVVITKSGFFFRGNPVGSIHKSIYDALQEATEAEASAAASQLSVGHGVLPYAHDVYINGTPHNVPAGALQASIEPRLVKAGRFAVWTGRASVIQGARGYEPVRVYGGKVNKQYRYMYRAAAAAQVFANSKAGQWAARAARWLEAA